MTVEETKGVVTVASVVVNTTVLISAAFLGRYIFRQSSAAVKHALLAVAMCVVAALPIATLTLGSSPFNVLRIPEKVLASSAATQTAADLTNNSPKIVSANQIYVENPQESLPHSTLSLPSPTAGEARLPVLADAPAKRAQPVNGNMVFSILFTMFAGIWLIGVLYFLARLTLCTARIHRERRESESVSERIQDIAAIARRLLGLKQEITILQSADNDEVSVPVTWGVIRPTILLPYRVEEWNDRCLCAALMHEMAHIRRQDWLIQMLSQVVCAIHWFNPLVWRAADKLRIDSESATDDIVLGLGLSPTQYAQSLVDVARTIPSSSFRSVVAVAMASPKDVNKRVLAILDSSRDRAPIGHRKIIASVLALCVIALPLAAIKVEAQPSTQPVPPTVPDVVPTPPSDALALAPTTPPLSTNSDQALIPTAQPVPVPTPEVKPSLDAQPTPPPAPAVPAPALPALPAPPARPVKVIIREWPSHSDVTRVIVTDGPYHVKYIQAVKSSDEVTNSDAIKIDWLANHKDFIADQQRVFANLSRQLGCLSSAQGISKKHLRELIIVQGKLAKLEPDLEKVESDALSKLEPELSGDLSESISKAEIESDKAMADQEYSNVKKVKLDELAIRDHVTSSGSDTADRHQLSEDILKALKKVPDKSSQDQQ